MKLTGLMIISLTSSLLSLCSAQNDGCPIGKTGPNCQTNCGLYGSSAKSSVRTPINNPLLKIIGGSSVSQANSYPSMAFVVFTWGARVWSESRQDYVYAEQSYGCGGTLIDTQTVLTTASCLPSQVRLSISTKKTAKKEEKKRKQKSAGPNIESKIGTKDYWSFFYDYYYDYNTDDAKEEEAEDVMTKVETNSHFPTLGSMFTVYLGTRDHDVHQKDEENNENRFSAVNFTQHEQFDELSLQNDIALIRLSRPVARLSNAIQVACLPPRKSDSFPGRNKNVRALGWGMTSDHFSSEAGFTQKLQSVTLRTYSGNQCGRVRQDRPKNWKSQMCAGDTSGRRAVCFGDEGGPLLKVYRLSNANYNQNNNRQFVVGVTSYGNENLCSARNSPAIFTRVAYFVDWIEDTIGKFQATNNNPETEITATPATKSTTLAPYSSTTSSQSTTTTTTTPSQSNSNITSDGSCVFGSFGDSCAKECGVSYTAPNQQIQQRIVGGVQAVAHSWPSQIWLLVCQGSSNCFSCGGTLISDRYVLTAAHCVSTQANRQHIVYMGMQDTRQTNGNTVRRMVASRVIPHENYSEDTLLHDIALLELPDAVQFNQYIQPACLPPTKDAASIPRANQPAWVVGWGKTSVTASSTPNILRNVRIEVYEPSFACRSSFYRSNDWSKQVCAGEVNGGKDSCQGDSGGPLFTTLPSNNGGNKYVLSGITSFGYSCAQPGFPGVYTRVAGYLDWIVKNTKQ